ncbi:hypothetical protein Hanom_Chr03g00182581 [Helianthus anomalus]
MVMGVTTAVPERIVPERAVNVEEFRTIGIVQMFERLGWERVLDWCEDNTPRIYFMVGMAGSVLPFFDGEPPLRSHLSVEGKILQGISLENIMVQFGDRRKVKGSDFWVLHAFMYGSPTLS